MAESYTTPHSLPVLGTADYVRSPTGDNIRKQLNALAVAANNAVTAEGVRAEGAAKTYADTGLNGKEGKIAAGTAAQYWRGDKTWQTLNSAAIPDLKITHIATAKPVTDVASTYPTGVSYFGTSATGWPAQFGTVHTVRWAAGRTVQTYSPTNGKTYTRVENGADVWTSWNENSSVGHSHANATTGSAGFMSAADKTNLDAVKVTKSVRLEAGKWVWDLAGATHYLIPDHTGALIARPTPHPVPDATPSLTW